MTTNFLKIPQYASTAWFSKIIMAIIYSQYSRELLLKSGKLSKKKDRLLELLNQLLKQQKSLKIDLNSFNLLKPTKELFQIMKMDVNIYDFMNSYGWHGWMFILKFLKYIDASYLSLDYYKNKLYFGIQDNLNLSVNISVGSIIYNTYSRLNNLYADKAYEELKKNQHPEYICVNVWKQETQNIAFHNFLELNLNRENVRYKLDIDTYSDITYSGIKELQEEIIYNNYVYKLDSCLLDNYKLDDRNSDKGIAHRYAISGVTLDNNKYFYNGEARIIKNREEYNLIYQNADKILPCELLKYDWNVRDYYNKITLSDAICNKTLNTISDDTKISYYFGRGVRTLIYVRQYKISNPELDKKEKEEKEERKMKRKLKNEIKTIIKGLTEDFKKSKDFFIQVKNKIREYKQKYKIVELAIKKAKTTDDKKKEIKNKTDIKIIIKQLYNGNKKRKGLLLEYKNGIKKLKDILKNITLNTLYDVNEKLKAQFKEIKNKINENIDKYE
jgi:hypothetical protein